MIDCEQVVHSAPWVASLFPAGATATEVRGTVSPTHLFREEQICVAMAVRKRQSEFAAGRLCARRALVEIGFGEAPLLTAKDRMPLWPIGAVGSISHTDEYCVAVVGLTRIFSGIGVDTEILGRVEPNLWRYAFRVEEINRLQDMRGPQQIEAATVMFCAKEAFYKCQFTMTREWLEFDDVLVEPFEDRFRIVVCNRSRRASSPLHGRFATDGVRVVCGIAM